MSLDTLLNLPLAKEVIIMLIAATPIFELRASIPVAMLTFDFPWYYALGISLVGNILPVPLILLTLETIIHWLSKINFFKRLFERLFAHAQNRSAIVERYESTGLIIFTAIPLPGTGAWTASIISIVLRLPFWRSFFTISIGVVIAGILVTILTSLGWIGATIAGILLIALIILRMRRKA